MPAGEELQLVRLHAAELDDQAVAEIGALLGGPPKIDVRRLQRLASAHGVAVARRACGHQPEIVGVALQEDGRIARARDRRFSSAQDENALRAFLVPSASLFRRRDRAPLGLVQALG